MKNMRINTKNIVDNANHTACPVAVEDRVSSIASESITRCDLSDDASTPIEGKKVMKNVVLDHVTLDQLKSLRYAIDEHLNIGNLRIHDKYTAKDEVRKAAGDVAEAEEALSLALKTWGQAKAALDQARVESVVASQKSRMALRATKAATKEFGKFYKMAPKSVQDKMRPYLFGGE